LKPLRENEVSVRTSRKIVTFRHPFVLRGVDRTLPPGDYPVITDEELIESLSFPVYRRISTMILLPNGLGTSASVEMMTVEADALKDAMDLDNAVARSQSGSGADPGRST
jgi:hypothetical protein